MLGPCSDILPGPDLPLIAYWPNFCFRVDDVDVRELPADLYRSAIRCYALELFPIEVMSYHRWRMLLVDIFDPAVLNHPIAWGARFRVKGYPLRYDANAALKVDARRSKCYGRPQIIQATNFRMKRSLWDRKFYNNHNPEPLFEADELQLYRSKCVQVVARLKTLNFKVNKHERLMKTMDNWIITPIPNRKFTKPFPGAIIHTAGEDGFVIRESGRGSVLVEFEYGDEYEERVVFIDDLEVLG